jgi:arylsulfatase B
MVKRNYQANLTTVLAGTLLLAPLAARHATAATAPAQPNVIIILADDLGYNDLGCQGSQDIPTPNIDRLAAEGVRCTSGYVTWPACAPSRAGIMTGQDSHRFGFYTNPNPILAADQGLPAGIMTVPKALQQRGYVTGGIGKWHLGTSHDRHPNQMGFTEWFGFLGGAHNYFPWEHYGKPVPRRPWPEWFVNQTLPIVRNDEPVPMKGYMTDILSDEATAFIQRHKAEPFFLYLSYTAPHSPWEAPDDEAAKLDLAKMIRQDPISAEFRRTYGAMVTRLDQGVGKVIAALRDANLDQRTLIFFLSDNGGGANRHDNGKPGYPSSNHPLRGSKGTLYEGGIRVPFLARWKGTLPAGVDYHQPVSSFDMGATALALAGGAPAGMPLDGVNILPHLTGQTKTAPHERLVWKLNGRGAIREGRYKLLTAEENAKYELYDLDADRSETRNIAAELPEIVQRLDATWKLWNADMKPPAWKNVPPTEWTKPEYQPPLWPPEKAAEFSFDHPAGPQFTDADKQAQLDKGNGIAGLVRMAFDSGAASVTIPPGDYRFGQETWGKDGPIYPLEFRGMNRDAAHPFRIIAEGVTFWFNLPPDQAPSAHFALRFIDCSHISLEGATLDRDPRGCMEGRITQLDDADNRIEIEASKGTLIPSIFSGELEQRLVPFNADGTFCAALYALQLKGPGQLMYRNVEPGTQPGRYWVNLHEKSELLKTNRSPAWRRAYGDAGTLQVGDGLSLVYTTTLAISLMDSTALKLIGVKSYITKGCSRELGGGGGHLWKDCYFGPRPGTCHWQGGEGFLSGCMERGSTYDGITMQHTTDDIMNINGFWGYLEKTEGQTMTLQRDHQMPAQPGDELNFFDAQTGQPAGKATVTAVSGQILTLDRDAAPFANAIAENPRFQCDGWTIKNCTFKDCYQRLLVQGGNGGTLRDNTFTRMGSHISLESNFFTKNEGGICRDILIENNIFDQVAIHPGGVSLVAGFQSLNHQASTALLSNITVRGNRFVDSGNPAIKFYLVNGGDISGNTFTNSGNPRSLVGKALPEDDLEPIQLKGCTDITSKHNQP